MGTCPRPPVFARPNILVASFATQAVVASFATQARARILSDHNIFYTPRGGGNGGVMPLGLFLFPWFLCFFLVVTCPRPPVFARPNKYSLCLSLHRQGLLSWVTVAYFTPPGGGQRRGLMPLGLFLFFFFLVVTCPRPPVFARPKKYSSCLSLHSRSPLPGASNFHTASVKRHFHKYIYF